MLRKVSRNCSSELSSAGSAPPKLPVKAPHQRNVPGAQIVETEPENPHRGRNPPTDAPPAHLPPDAPATAAPWSSGPGPADISTGSRAPVQTTATGWSSPVETTSYVGDLDKLDHPG